MLRKLLFIGLFAFVLAACSGNTVENETNEVAATNEAMNEEMMNDEAMNEEMMDNEAMNEEMMDDEAMNEEMADGEVMDEEMMDDEAMNEEMADDEAMDEEMMDDEAMDEEMMDDEAMDEEMMDEFVDFTVTIENISDQFAYSSAGVFNTPAGADEAGPALPGNSYTANFYAAPGSNLSFATMFVQSNDLFFGPDEAGIPLYDDAGNPITGDVTDLVQLWDAGTEADQPIGEGADQAPRQAGPDTGDDDPDNTVRLVTEGLPAVNELIAVTLEAGENGHFTLNIENISEASAAPSPLAPGVFIVHTNPAPYFTTGEADRGEGLEALAEDGNPAGLIEALNANTGIATPLAPGVFAIHTTSDVFFVAGEADRGLGLEALAEDGNPAGLAESLMDGEGIYNVGVFNTPEGAEEPGPLLPGNSYTFNFQASNGHYLTFATMFVHSNDWFYGLENFALFDADGNPITGDVTLEIILWDAGTEVDEAPGFGPNQAPRQAGPDTGDDQNSTIEVVENAPATPQVILVTISTE